MSRWRQYVDSKGIVRKILEEKGTLLVSFYQHDGYFYLPDAETEMREKVTESRDRQREISFSFNSGLRILSVR